MKTMNYLMMMLIWIIALISVCLCFPSKPLNERSTELAWEAWLLVDQSRQTDFGALRRKITPKSIFVVPTFSPDTLPACAEGYKSDPMGRCVKIIKINESLHFNFLLQQLNQQFSDYEDTIEEEVAQGPLQLNIPLVENEEENETDFAIVVTPTRTAYFENTSINAKRKGDNSFNVENIAEILGVKPEDVELTTIAQLTEIPTTSASMETTTVFPVTSTTVNDVETTTNVGTTTGNEEVSETTTQETTTETITNPTTQSELLIITE